MPEFVTKTIPASQIRKGDIYYGMVVDDVKFGTKKFTAYGKSGRTILYVDQSQDVMITREQPTEEEREAQKRAYYNEQIAHFVEDHDQDWAHAQSKFAKEIEGGYDAERYSFVYSALMYAHATHALKVELVQLHDGVRNRQSRDHEPLSDWVDIWAMFREDKIEKLVDYGFRGDSRSASQVSNILEDIQHEVTANAVRRVEYPY